MKMRLGKFYIDRAAITGDGTPEVLKLLAFVPYRVELLAHRDQFEYMGTSKAFNEHTPGEKVPTYNVIVEQKRNKETKKQKSWK